MGLGQLYYTSCHTGLAGHPGYQFNAATPGISPDVMRDVEALTAYEAPRSLTAAGAEVSAYPVNLCHLPGETTVVANVAFVGEDYSRRSGNYFAHALVTRSARRDLAGCLPIELWRSPGWVDRPVEHTDLPELPAPPPRGAIAPDTVAAFLAESGADHHFAAMLTAAELAIREGERKLIIIADDSDTVAYWIAALSYALPADSVQLMSFMTYSREPRYSRTAIVGALPEVDIERGTGFDNYYLFDLIADRATELPAHPLARLLAQVGVAAAPGLWQRARGLAAGTESGLTAWYPVVVAATVSSPGADRLDVEPLPLVDWLDGNAGRLDTELVADLGAMAATALAERADAGGATMVDALRQLVALAGRLGLAALADQAEVALVDAALGSPHALASGVVVRGEAARRYATNQLERRIAGLPAGAALALLRWARRNELRPDNMVLYQVGVALVGPAVLDRPGDPLPQVLRDWPAVRQGVVVYLAAWAERDPDGVVGFLTGPGAATVELDGTDLDGHAALAEAVAVADAQSGRIGTFDALRTVAERRRLAGRLPGIDGALLRRLWPAGWWTAAEATGIATRLDPADLDEPAVLAGLAAAVLQQPTLSNLDEYARHTELCEAVRVSPAFSTLDARARERVLDLLAADADVERLVAADTRQAFERTFRALHDMASVRPARRQRVEDELLRRHRQLTAYRLAVLVTNLSTYRRRLFASLAGRLADREDLSTAGKLWCVRHELLKRKGPGSKAAIGDLERLLLPALRRWRRRDLRRLQEHLEKQRDPHAATTLALWSEGDGAGFVSRLARNVWTRAGRYAAGDPANKHGHDR
jgi:hypothetical protein